MPCEITSLDIKAGVNDHCKMIVFKFSKNEKGDKKKSDDIAQYLIGYRGGGGGDQGKGEEANYDGFQQVSEETKEI